MDDPKIYTKPFVLATSGFMWIPTQEAEEQLCVPSEAIVYVNTIAVRDRCGSKAQAIGPKDRQQKVELPYRRCPDIPEEIGRQTSEPCAAVAALAYPGGRRLALYSGPRSGFAAVAS